VEKDELMKLKNDQTCQFEVCYFVWGLYLLYMQM